MSESATQTRTLHSYRRFSIVDRQNSITDQDLHDQIIQTDQTDSDVETLTVIDSDQTGPGQAGPAVGPGRGTVTAGSMAFVNSR
jgi:hypothetical protein